MLLYPAILISLLFCSSFVGFLCTFLRIFFNTGSGHLLIALLLPFNVYGFSVFSFFSLCSFLPFLCGAVIALTGTQHNVTGRARIGVFQS